MQSPDLPIPLHDATLASFAKQAEDLVISLVKWDATSLTLRCRDVVLLRNQVGDGDLEELIECVDSEILREVRQHLIHLTFSPAQTEQYRHFRLLDTSNAPVLDVVCTALGVEADGLNPGA